MGQNPDVAKFMFAYSIPFLLTFPNFVTSYLTIFEFNEVEDELENFRLFINDTEVCDSGIVKTRIFVCIFSNTIYLILILISCCSFWWILDYTLVTQDSEPGLLLYLFVFLFFVALSKVATSSKLVGKVGLKFDCFTSVEEFSNFIKRLEVLIVLENIYFYLFFIVCAMAFVGTGIGICLGD